MFLSQLSQQSRTNRHSLASLASKVLNELGQCFKEIALPDDLQLEAGLDLQERDTPVDHREPDVSAGGQLKQSKKDIWAIYSFVVRNINASTLPADQIEQLKRLLVLSEGSGTSMKEFEFYLGAGSIWVILRSVRLDAKDSEGS